MKQIGPYQVVRELGRGAMGVVFEVRGQAGERLALKMILQPDTGSQERFRREAEVLSFLGRHPNVVSYRDAGLEGGHPYIVMDFVEGRTFGDALKDGLPRDEALRVLIAVARALHFGHEANVLHRDVKPANVLVGNDGRAYLSDFGVAKSLQADRLTLTGEMIGTPAYMAPEQVDGSPEIDRRADVYALGAVLYEVLSGVRPFAGDKISMVKKILMDPPPPPSQRGSKRAPAPDLEALCLQSLAKTPEERPPTAEAFAAALEEHLGGARAPVGARGGSPSRPLLLAPVLLLVGLGGGLVGRATAAAQEPAPSATSTPTPNATPTPSATPTVADLGLRLLRGDGGPLDDLARRPIATTAEALVTARALRLAVRTSPATSAAAAPALVRASEALLSAVDPSRDGDAALVDEAWDCLISAWIAQPTMTLRRPLRAFAELERARARAVQRAASPWRSLFTHEVSSLLPNAVELALTESVGVSGPAWVSSRPKWPGLWGLVASQIHRSTDWNGWLDAIDQRYRVLGQLTLLRPDLPHLQYALATTLREQGRAKEAAIVLKRSFPSESDATSLGRAARIAEHGDLELAIRLSRKGHGLLPPDPKTDKRKKTRAWAGVKLAELLETRGKPSDLKEALDVLEAARSRLGTHQRWNLVRAAIARRQGQDPAPWVAAARRYRRWLIKRTFEDWPEATRERLYPKEPN